MPETAAEVAEYMAELYYLDLSRAYSHAGAAKDAWLAAVEAAARLEAVWREAEAEADALAAAQAAEHAAQDGPPF